MNAAKRIIIVIVSAIIAFFACFAVGITKDDKVGWIVAIVIFIVSYITGKSNE